LFFPVAANQVWNVDLSFRYNAFCSAGGRIGFFLPTGSILSLYGAIFNPAGDAHALQAASITVGDEVRFDMSQDLLDSTSDADTQDCCQACSVMFTAGATGFLTVGFANDAQAGSDTMTMRSTSMLIAQRVR